MTTTSALLASAPGAALELAQIERRDLRPDDVSVRVTHSGVCFTDLHRLASPDSRMFPLVPGHEFVGVVSAVGAAVTKFRVGDAVAIGNIVDSCGECKWCLRGQESWCEEIPTQTYSGEDRHDGTRTFGGFSGEYVARDRFVHHRPTTLDPAGVAPLLCAGITVWDPLRAEEAGPGTRVGVAGIGGLGHLAVRLAAALGAEVTAFTTSQSKAADAKRLGATHVVVSSDAHAMAAAAETLDVLIDTIGFEHDLTPYVRALDVHGVLYPVGYLGPLSIDSMSLLVGRKRLSSSGGGGVDRVAELLEFCGRHEITADVEVVPAADAMTALSRLTANDVRYRFVLDTSALA